MELNFHLFKLFIDSIDELKRQFYGKTRQQAGRKPVPSYAIIDSQSVKTVYKGEGMGFDGNKKNQVP